jgi:predicted nucleic acid-binding protein
VRGAFSRRQRQRKHRIPEPGCHDSARCLSLSTRPACDLLGDAQSPSQSPDSSLKVSEQTADAYLSAIAAYAHLGALGASPQLTLGSTGVIPLRDTEDGHVLETAIAGRADFLITANFKDFITKNTAVVALDRYAIHQSPDGTVHIVHPYLMMEWLRTGKLPDLQHHQS